MVTLSLKLMIIFRVTDCVYIIIAPTIMYTLFRTDYKSWGFYQIGTSHIKSNFQFLFSFSGCSISNLHVFYNVKLVYLCIYDLFRILMSLWHTQGPTECIYKCICVYIIYVCVFSSRKGAAKVFIVYPITQYTASIIWTNWDWESSVNQTVLIIKHACALLTAWSTVLEKPPVLS
jgi:hypothetical protein